MQVKDLITGQEFILVDVGLSHTIVPDIVLASHIVAPCGLHMTTGAALPIMDHVMFA